MPIKILIENFSITNLKDFFREEITTFKPDEENYEYLFDDNEYISENYEDIKKIGEADLTNTDDLLVITAKSLSHITSRTGKKRQFEIAKKILKEENKDAAFFVFHDDDGNFRFSLIRVNFLGTKRDFTDFKRYTYFVSPKQTNKTFINQIAKCDFNSLESIQDAFSVEPITKQFYEKLQRWYFWAIKNVEFPQDAEKETNGREVAIIRLITRLVFIWFMKVRNLIPDELFDEENINKILKDFSAEESTYYKAILQNLFFATLNTEQKERKFRSEVRGPKGFNPDYGNKNVFRYQNLFNDSGLLKKLFGDIPFLNGGLFECLDYEPKGKDKNDKKFIDGFTAIKGQQPKVPNFLFFAGIEKVDISTFFGKKNNTYEVEGLINLLNSYNFTIDENEPDDVEVALDPELLGSIFENLLASYNPETATTARKATGSFYTPREIVNYMTNESLKQYFKTNLKTNSGIDENLEKLINSSSSENPFDKESTKNIIELINNLRVVDPAVGSGAFPMAMLNKLVFILGKLDPDNIYWKKLQKDQAIRESEKAYNEGDKKVRHNKLEKIEKTFNRNTEKDYGRKLYLIEKCIYGVDIQQIAVEIAKLRFFISLLVDEKIDFDKPENNYGIEPLPNLDFKLMQGNSLISTYAGIDFNEEKTEDLFVDDNEPYNKLIKEFEELKHQYQNEADNRIKKELREEIDKAVINIFEEKISGHFPEVKRIEETAKLFKKEGNRKSYIADEKKKLYKRLGFNIEQTEKDLVAYTEGRKEKDFFLWKVYFAEVFNEKGGFDIVIGNPPYGILNKKQNKSESIIVSDEDLKYYKESEYYKPATGRMLNIFRLFILRSIRILNDYGTFSEIFPLSFIGDLSITKLRRYILENTQILSIEAFPERDNPNKRVFEAVKMSVCILNLLKSKGNKSFFIRINNDKFINKLLPKSFIDYEKIKILDKNNLNFPLTSSNETNLLVKIFKVSKRFEEIGKCNTGEIDMTFCKTAFSNNSRNATLLKGAIIDRYLLKTKMSQGEIVFIDEKKLLTIKKINSDLKKGSRIVLQGITGVNEKNRLKMMIVKDTYCANSLNYLTFKKQVNIIYLLGLFNSKLLNFVFSKFSTNSNVNGYEVDNLPIVLPNNTQQKFLENLVDKIITKKEYFEDTAAEEQTIDIMVYKLYDLTYEEVKIVDPTFVLSKMEYDNFAI